MNVSLTPDLERFTKALVEGGRYNSASEVVRSGLRLLEEREARVADLRRLIADGLGSGAPVSVTREQMREAMGERMDALRIEAERGERPAPGGPDAITI